MPPDRDRRTPSRTAKLTVALLIALVLAGAVLLQYSLDSAFATREPRKQSLPMDTGRSVLNLLGGVRETLAAYFWTKTDTVFHEYYGASPERSQPIYPYYWLITRLDPHFVMAYYYASYMLCRLGRVNEGLDLALEGVKYNPSSATLMDNLSQIYLYFKGDPAKARYYCLKAISLSHDEGDRAAFRKFLSIIDDIIAGKKPMPRVSTFEQLRKVSEELEKQEGDHEH
jgi:tetratricopeptide (TPR) repeat protein